MITSATPMACSSGSPSPSPPGRAERDPGGGADAEPLVGGIVEGEGVVRHVGVGRAERAADHRHAPSGRPAGRPARRPGTPPAAAGPARSTRPRGCGTRPGRRRPTAGSPGSRPGRRARSGRSAGRRPGTARRGPGPGAGRARARPARAEQPRPLAPARVAGVLLLQDQLVARPPASSSAPSRLSVTPDSVPPRAGSAVTANRSFSMTGRAGAPARPRSRPPGTAR